MKSNALDQAAALQNWDLPEVFQHLRHLLEARMGNKGKREFILGSCGCLRRCPRRLSPMP